MSMKNAAPMVHDRGIQDLSTRTIPTVPLEIPQHLPLFYIFSGKGPVGRHYADLSEASLTQLYGDDAFDVNGKYYTHVTPFLEAVAKKGNNCVIHRLVAEDAKDVANLAMYLDVLPTQVPVFAKNSDGSIRLDETGEVVYATDGSGNPLTVQGYKVAWVLDKTVCPVGEYQRGLLTQRNGIQVDGATQSTQYPIFEFAAKDQGEDAHKLAIKMFPALQTDLMPFPSALLEDSKIYPYYFGMTKVADTITGKLASVLNAFGAQTSSVVFKDKGIDPNSGAVMDLAKVTKDQYIELPAELSTGLGVAYTYHANLVELLTGFYNAEKNIADDHRDEVINNEEQNIHAINILSFTSSNGSPYQSIRLVDLEGSTRITRNTNLFLSGSSDGTINEEVLDGLVLADLDNYNNGLHHYNDLVANPESILYDSGFSLAVKKALPKFISRRKDTFFVVSTYAHDAFALTLESQYSVALAVKTMAELYPESVYYGTPVARCIVMGGSGEIINSLYTKRVPVSYELATKAAQYMGASNGAWKNGYLFDRAPLSVISELKNIDVTWVPASTRETLWSVGMNFVLNYKVREQFMPALQTIYENDTSVLNSFFAVVAMCYINKVEHAAWREFTGSISLTDSQLEEKVNEFVSSQLKDKFDNLFVIIPDAKVTEFDSIRGYSWTLNVKFYANNMKTVMTASVSAYRMSDLEV